MDRIIDEHFFGYRARDGVDNVMASLAPASSTGGAVARQRLHDPAASAHTTRLFGAVRGSVTPIRRLYGDGFMVDRRCGTDRIERFDLPLRREERPGELRLLHVFEFADGGITREPRGAISPRSSASSARRVRTLSQWRNPRANQRAEQAAHACRHDRRRPWCASCAGGATPTVAQAAGSRRRVAATAYRYFPTPEGPADEVATVTPAMQPVE